MTDQTRWGIDLIQVKNKAIKYQKDLVTEATKIIEKMDQGSLEDMALIIEAKYERKYVENKTDKLVL
tara:strand:+ start:53 stop:253 length:201 start_codon:yes stop_codon:yes gene_type:complete